MVCTSPPYWGLRDYGTASWDGGDPGCDHRGPAQQSQASTLAGNGHGNGKPLSPALQAQSVPYRDRCGKCGATRQDRQLGLERTPDEYVAAMVSVFREVRRVLRKDGTLWLNLGDCYATGAGKVGTEPGGGDQGERWKGYRGARNGSEGKHGYAVDGGLPLGPVTQPNRMPLPGLKPKDLVGIPWRVAFALQADGWVLRSEIVWAKPNPMPESVTDRPTKSHEQLFLFSKGKRIGPEPTVWDDIQDIDARWLAGIIDAEGSIIVRRESPKGEDYGAHAAQVSVGNTSRALLDEVVRIVGQGNVLERPGQNAPMWYWQASNKVALGILRRIYPFLIVKQRQARCAIALEEGKSYPGGHARIQASEVERRERLWQAVKSLNHFGSPDLTGIPEPVFGRWTSAVYHYDADAIREPLEHPNRTGTNPRLAVDNTGLGAHGSAIRGGIDSNPSGRNRRSVWTIATKPYPGAHFATFPEALVEPCILAGTSEAGACATCGAPWRRVVERPENPYPGSSHTHERDAEQGGTQTHASGKPAGTIMAQRWHARGAGGTTTGWEPTCDHGGDPVPCVVMDPFAGTGTVGVVAQRLSRRAVLIDLNPEYLRQCLERNQQAPLGLSA